MNQIQNVSKVKRERAYTKINTHFVVSQTGHNLKKLKALKIRFCVCKSTICQSLLNEEQLKVTKSKRIKNMSYLIIIRKTTFSTSPYLIDKIF